MLETRGMHPEEGRRANARKRQARIAPVVNAIDKANRMANDWITAGTGETFEEWSRRQRGDE